MNTICPCCKSTVAADIPICDLNTNTIALGLVGVRVQPQRAELYSAIAERYPGTATYGYLVQRMWAPCNEPPAPFENIKQQVWHLRRVLRNLGFDIKSTPTIGYRLERL
jgi:DNA-binding response OmpR family regulator